MTSIPHHVGIILDGNRRFAKRLLLEPWKGHEWGAKKVEELFMWCKELGIRELTLYCFSVQNFNRPREEFLYLMKIFKESFDKLMKDTRIDEYQARIRVIGRLSLFPEDLQQKLFAIMERTKYYDQYCVNFAMAYGGQEEIIDATKRIAEQVKQGVLEPESIDKETFRQYLYLPDEPELIIRTSGEHRISNFLSFQGAYAEYIFLDIMWPEFTKEHLMDCLAEYSKRQRRFGQ
ncbi:di-trans,poly-cis-decaprenylcistransferase [Candidatus Woesearchaeota archaeon]|nr:di-trans,poly-cis-decaprenylcistransferase [Candidatus Woesearchaeota archaeon]